VFEAFEFTRHYVRCCDSDDSTMSSEAVRLHDDLHVTFDRMQSLQTEIQNRDHVIKELMANQEQLNQRAKQVSFIIMCH